jgi:hypothetical protein
MSAFDHKGTPLRRQFQPIRINAMRSIIFLALYLGCVPLVISATNAPCDLVHRGITEAQRKEWSPSIDRQLNGHLASINQAFALSGWVIVFVDAKQADPPFLFFHGSPAKTHYITMWSGAAMRSEQAQTKGWALREVPGIPDGLASCFAWQVTQGQDRPADFGE